MRLLLGLVALTGAGLGFQGASDLMKQHAERLSTAASLTSVFTVQPVPGTPVEYRLSYAKPNLLRVESPTWLLVSDGAKIWELDKAGNTYTEASVTPGAILGAAERVEVLPWSAFFGDALLKKATKVHAGVKRNVKGKSVSELVMTYPGKVVTLYIDAKLGFARGMVVREKKGDAEQETLVLAKELEAGASPLDPAEFQFVAPAGATKKEAPAASEATYAEVAQIFRQSCMRCHGASSPTLNLSTHAAIMASGTVIAGNSAGSSLVQYITGVKTPRMPKGRDPLSPASIEKIKAWIDAGAKP